MTSQYKTQCQSLLVSLLLKPHKNIVSEREWDLQWRWEMQIHTSQTCFNWKQLTNTIVNNNSLSYIVVIFWWASSSFNRRKSVTWPTGYCLDSFLLLPSEKDTSANGWLSQQMTHHWLIVITYPTIFLPTQHLSTLKAITEWNIYTLFCNLNSTTVSKRRSMKTLNLTSSSFNLR